MGMLHSSGQTGENNLLSKQFLLARDFVEELGAFRNCDPINIVQCNNNSFSIPILQIRQCELIGEKQKQFVRYLRRFNKRGENLVPCT